MDAKTKLKFGSCPLDKWSSNKDELKELMSSQAADMKAQFQDTFSPWQAELQAVHAKDPEKVSVGHGAQELGAASLFLVALDARSPRRAVTRARMAGARAEARLTVDVAAEMPREAAARHELVRGAGMAAPGGGLRAALLVEHGRARRRRVHPPRARSGYNAHALLP